MSNNIIFFDGICVFCDSFINFIVKRDKKKLFKLCHLQSDLAQSFAKKNNFVIDKNSLILFQNGIVFNKSSAVIVILKDLGGPWIALSLLLLIPKIIRDFFYDYFGNNRYRWFGKKQSCTVDRKEIADRMKII